MKNRVSATCLALLLSINLSSCSTNTQKHNTTTGTIAGALIGAGTGTFIGQGVGKAVAVGVGLVGGALIGGSIGHHMESSDHVKMYKAMNNSTQHTTRWKNHHTGASYSVRPTTKMTAIGANPYCRQFEGTATIQGKTQQFTGTACRQADGTWQAVKA